MNREIKYRAWDKKEKKFVQDIFLAIDGWYFQQSMDDYNENIVIQLFAELTDKSGVEIYEGDIVDVRMNKSKNDAMDSNIGIRDIAWQNGGLFLRDYSNSLAWQCENFDIEVIGNIYENPELLPE